MPSVKKEARSTKKGGGNSFRSFDQPANPFIARPIKSGPREQREKERSKSRRDPQTKNWRGGGNPSSRSLFEYGNGLTLFLSSLSSIPLSAPPSSSLPSLQAALESHLRRGGVQRLLPVWILNPHWTPSCMSSGSFYEALHVCWSVLKTWKGEGEVLAAGHILMKEREKSKPGPVKKEESCFLFFPFSVHAQ